MIKKGMTIEKALSENMGRQIKLGFGSSFVYCDTITKASFDEISEMSDKYLEHFKANLQSSKTRLKYLLEKGEETYIAENLKREEEKKKKDEICGIKPEKDKVVKDAEFFSVEYYRKIGSISKLIVETKKSIDNFCPFLEATVNDSFESVDEDAIIVLSKRNPRVIGMYWTCEEYRRGYVEISEDIEDEEL